MRIVSVVGHNVRNAVAEARRALNVKLKDSREKTRSSEDNLHRITLTNGDVVEVTVVKGAKSKVEYIAN